MKTNKEILYILQRFKEAKIELKKYMNWIEQIKLETVLQVQSERQCNYYRIPLQQFDTNKVKANSFPTNESLSDELKNNQMTFQSQQQDFNQDDVRSFINKYEKMLQNTPNQQEQLSRSSRKLLIEKDTKQHFGTSTIEDMFKLSYSHSDSQQQDSSEYDTSNFGKDIRVKAQSNENNFNGLMNYSKECEQEQSIQSSQEFKDYFQAEQNQYIKVQNGYQANNVQSNQKKSFEQFYQEHVEGEIHNIQQEIEDIQRFLKRVQTAEEKLTSSFKDLQQIPIMNRQGSENSIEKVTEDLKLIDTIKANMMKYMESNIDPDKLKKLRNMKYQIQLYFNNVEDELLKINEGSIQI